MGQVVKLKPPSVAYENVAKLADKVERQAREIRALKKNNKALIKIINGAHHAHIALLNEQMRRSMRLTEECMCIPDRADFLRAIARD